MRQRPRFKKAHRRLDSPLTGDTRLGVVAKERHSIGAVAKRTGISVKTLRISGWSCTSAGRPGRLPSGPAGGTRKL